MLILLLIMYLLEVAILAVYQFLWVDIAFAPVWIFLTGKLVYDIEKYGIDD